MYALVERCREAAALTGWTRSAVPWPAALPTQVSVQALARHAHGDGVPIGLIDLPEQQRRETGYLDDRVQQLAVDRRLVGARAGGADHLRRHAGVDALARRRAHLRHRPARPFAVAARRPAPLRRRRRPQRAARPAHRAVDAHRRGAAQGRHGVDRVVEHLGARGRHRRAAAADRAARQRRRPHPLGHRGDAIEPPDAADDADVRGGRRAVPDRARRAAARRQQPARLEHQQPADHGDRRPGRVRRRRCPPLVRLRSAHAPPGGVGARQAAHPARPVRPGRHQRRSGRSSASPNRCPAPTHHPPPPLRRRPVAVAVGHRQADASRSRRRRSFLAPLPVAIDTNSGDWCWIDAIDDGPLLGVVGPPKSGRSTMLGVLAHLAAEQGWTVVNATTSRRSPLAVSPDPVLANRCDPAQLGEVVERHHPAGCSCSSTTSSGSTTSAASRPPSSTASGC